MDRRERFADPEEVLRMAMAGKQAAIWTALPGYIVSFNKDKMTATVQPCVQGVVQDQTGASRAVNLPILPDVPVQFPRGGGCSLTFPVKPNDECLIIFSSRCIDGWYQSGGVQLPMHPRMHDLSDGFAIVGVSSQPHVIPGGVDTDKVQLRTDDGQTAISINPSDHSIDIAASGPVTAASASMVTVAAQQSASLGAGTDVTVSGNGSASLTGAGSVTVSSSGTATVSGSFTMLGAGSVGNLASLPAPANGVYSSFSSSGLSAIYQNPVASNVSNLTTTISDPALSTGLADAVTAGTITPDQQTDITNALQGSTGTGGLLGAASDLGKHTDLLSGLAPVTGANVPHLSGIVGVSGGLDHVAGGAFGSSSDLLGGMTTGLTAGPSLDGAHSYVSSILDRLSNPTAPGNDPASIVSAINSHTATLSGYVSNDTASYTAAQNKVKQSSSFLQAVSLAKSQNPAIQSLLGSISPSAVTNALKTLG